MPVARCEFGRILNGFFLSQKPRFGGGEEPQKEWIFAKFSFGMVLFRFSLATTSVLRPKRSVSYRKSISSGSLQIEASKPHLHVQL
jgi:hypothetical protein